MAFATLHLLVGEPKGHFGLNFNDVLYAFHHS
jgi:hypothetical protein